MGEDAELHLLDPDKKPMFTADGSMVGLWLGIFAVGGLVIPILSCASGSLCLALISWPLLMLVSVAVFNA